MADRSIDLSAQPAGRRNFMKTGVNLEAAWRSVYSLTLAFPHQCFVDELAHKVGENPLAFRLTMLTKPSDFKQSLLKLKYMSSWAKPLPKGRGLAQWEFLPDSVRRWWK